VPQLFSRVTVPRKAKDDAVVGLLSLHDPLGFVEEGTDLVACYRDAEAARAAVAALSGRSIRCDLVTDIVEEDSLEAFRRASRPFTVGRHFWIDPGDPSDSVPPAGRIALRLPASLAFGTGGHESTRLALLALEDEPPENRAVLDVGTGSAVLALAAVALGASLAIGYDTDADAIFVARDNVRRHRFGNRVHLVAGAAAAIGGMFPVVLANLLPDEFFSIRREVLARVAPGGRLVLSGIPREREGEVVGRVRSRRFAVAGRRTENDWSCVWLERLSAS
jgi:ribosomal protein L11 methyltransferase